jgi:hypothetical protein
MDTYIETDCKIEIDGRTFENGGAYQTDTHIIGYMSKDMTELTDWHRNKLGNAHVSSSWRVYSVWTDRYYQVYVCIKGIYYTGRTAGAGMVFHGKRCAKQ